MTDPDRAGIQQSAGFLVALLLCLVSAPPFFAQAPPGAVVTQVDHVIIRTNERERLVAILADTLGLPVVWPQPGSDWTISTGLALGNLNLEIFQSRMPTRTPISELAFQPVDFATTSRRLKERGLDPREPGSYTDSSGVKRWSTLGFRHPFKGATFFVVQYHQFDMNERRARFEKALRDRNGGPLRLRRVRQLRLAYAPGSVEAARESWSRVIGASRAGTSGLFTPLAGPAISVIQAGGQDAGSILVEVESITVAKREASLRSLLKSASADSLVLDPARFGGLRIILVGATKAR